MQRYGLELLRALDMLLERCREDNYSIKVLIPRNARNTPQYKHLCIHRVGSFIGRIWEQLELPLYCRGKLLFTPCGGPPRFHRKNVVTIHDAAVFAAPDGYSTGFRNWYRYLYKATAKRALHVLTVSEFSKSELVRFCGINAGNITVIYLGCDHSRECAADPFILRKNGLSDKRYVFAVSSHNPNKNFHGIVAAIERLSTGNLEVAIAGGKNRNVFGDVVKIPDKVKELGYVSDSELRALYENAACFVFPSFYEGFGLPPLEALSLGCPVVVSNRASLPELFEKVAFLCEPDDPNDIALQIIRASRVGAASREENIRFASQFTWEKCAQATWELLKHAVRFSEQ